MQPFWEEQHKQNNTYWLSNYDSNSILKNHNFNVKDFKGKEILDIGVGTGIFSKELSANNKVISVDISYEALDKVKNFAETYHTSLLNQIRPVDFAICNLVFQHCNNNEIERIINDVQLKDTGVFSFQFAFLREEPNDNVKKLINLGTHYFRSLAEIIEMVNRSDKKIVYISEPVHFYNPENISWYFVKVMRK